jgi:hypothetical protein
LRHGFDTAFSGVSKFSPNLSKLEIKELILNSIKNANTRTDLIIKPNGYMDILYDTGKVIGKDVNGNTTSKIMIHLDSNFNVRTAYPK